MKIGASDDLRMSWLQQTRNMTRRCPCLQRPPPLFFKPRWVPVEVAGLNNRIYVITVSFLLVFLTAAFFLSRERICSVLYGCVRVRRFITFFCQIYQFFGIFLPCGSTFSPSAGSTACAASKTFATSRVLLPPLLTTSIFLRYHVAYPILAQCLPNAFAQFCSSIL